MKYVTLAVILATIGATRIQAQSGEGSVRVLFGQPRGSLNIDRMALGQGGLSDEPMWENRVSEIRALRPRLIRLFIQEYFQPLPAKGRDHFETLDRSVDTIIKTGARPLMCICFK